MKTNSKNFLKAIFLDRDGVLIEEPKDDNVSSWKKFKIKEDVLALTSLENRYKLFIVTNQKGLNQGKISKKFYKESNIKLLDFLKIHGINIEGIYTCPHSKLDKCDCMKPKTGLIRQILKNHCVDIKNSWLIGDRSTDVKLGKNIGSKTIYIQSNTHGLYRITPDFIAKDLNQAVKFINKNKF